MFVNGSWSGNCLSPGKAAVRWGSSSIVDPINEAESTERKSLREKEKEHFGIVRLLFGFVREEFVRRGNFERNSEDLNPCEDDTKAVLASPLFIVTILFMLLCYGIPRKTHADKALAYKKEIEVS